MGILKFLKNENKMEKQVKKKGKSMLSEKFKKIKIIIRKILLLFNYEFFFNFDINKYKLQKIYSNRPSIQFVKEKKTNKNLIVAEVGVEEAKNAENMLKILPIKKFYAIDPWKEAIKSEKIARKRLSKFGDKVIIVKKNSEDAVKDIKEKLDFIYIDANHTYEYIKQDIENYYKLLKVGGILGGHDIINYLRYDKNVGVSKAVAEFVVKNNLNFFIDKNDWWFEKPGK